MSDSSMKQVIVRDRRGRSWLWADHAVIDEFGPHIGPNAIAVYMLLCRLADAEKQTAFPSYDRIASAIGVSRPTAIKAVARLEECSLISKEARDSDEGDATSNLYTLLPVSSWRKPGNEGPEFNVLRGSKNSLPRRKTVVSDEDSLPQVVNDVYHGGKNPLPYKETVHKETIYKETTTTLNHDKETVNSVVDVVENCAKHMNSASRFGAKRRQFVECEITKRLYDFGIRPRAVCEKLARGEYSPEPGAAPISRGQVRRQVQWWPLRHEASAEWNAKEVARGKFWQPGQLLMQRLKTDAAAPPIVAQRLAAARRVADHVENMERERIAANDPLAQELAEESEIARTFWQTLTNAQRVAFDADFQEHWDEKYRDHAGEPNPDKYFDKRKPAHALEKAQYLNEPSTRGWLANLQSKGAPRAELAAPLQRIAQIGSENNFEYSSTRKPAPSGFEALFLDNNATDAFVRNLNESQKMRINELAREKTKMFDTPPTEDSPLWAQIRRNAARELIKNGEIECGMTAEMAA